MRVLVDAPGGVVEVEGGGVECEDGEDAAGKESPQHNCARGNLEESVWGEWGEEGAVSTSILSIYLLRCILSFSSLPYR